MKAALGAGALDVRPHQARQGLCVPRPYLQKWTDATALACFEGRHSRLHGDTQHHMMSDPLGTCKQDRGCLFWGSHTASRWSALDHMLSEDDTCVFTCIYLCLYLYLLRTRRIGSEGSSPKIS